jgi:hypothetical protein
VARSLEATEGKPHLKPGAPCPPWRHASAVSLSLSQQIKNHPPSFTEKKWKFTVSIKPTLRSLPPLEEKGKEKGKVTEVLSRNPTIVIIKATKPSKKEETQN